MSTDLAELRRTIQQLSQKDRAALAHDILLTLEDDEEGAEEAWQAEVKKRVDEYHSGQMTSITEDELFARLNAKYPRVDTL